MEDYKILHQLGSGSYGSAHLALHIPSGSKCVVKEIKISHMSPKELLEARREVEVLSSLSHKFITQFRYSSESDGKLYIAMDYCGGGDLHTIIINRGEVLFPEDRVLDWFAQLSLAIKYIHDRKILHRDIKSQNIFLTDEGRVKLGDFGIAKVMNSTTDLARTCIGTPYYLSPEMCENKPYNNKSDIWALGCVLYEMITLKHAFEANNMKALILKIIKGAYQPIPPRYSRELRLLVGQIFQREPQARPSISVILRKPFILKKVPKFITGCEEEDLMSSLMRRKYSMPASAKRVPVVKRPKDVTEPAAKYGTSVSVNKKSPKKLPSKAVKKNSRKVNAVNSVKIDTLRRGNRMKCPSDDRPYSVDQKAPVKRSTSVPRVYKSEIHKSSLQCGKKRKQASPQKLQLMLDSAGLSNSAEMITSAKVVDDKNKKKKKIVQSIDASSEFVDMNEAKNPAETNSSYVDEILEQIQSGKIWSGSEFVQPNGSVSSHENKIHEISNPRKTIEDSGKQETSQKKAKELVNQTLKQQTEHDSDEENFVLPESADELRLRVQEKMLKLVQERAQKMNKMLQERRKWAYQREKLVSSLQKKTSDESNVPSGYRASSGSDFDIDFACQESPKNLLDTIRSSYSINNETSTGNDNIMFERNDLYAIEKDNDSEDELMMTIKRTNNTVWDIKCQDKGIENVAKDNNNSCSTTDDINVALSSDLTRKGNVAKVENECDDSTSEMKDQISSPIRVAQGRARWGDINTAGLENSPLESTGSAMERTSSEDMVVVFSKAAQRKQWEKDGKDIVNVLQEADIVKNATIKRNCEVMSTEQMQLAGRLHTTDTNSMGSTFTVCPNQNAKGCKVENAEALQPKDIEKRDFLNSTFTISKDQTWGECHTSNNSSCSSTLKPESIEIDFGKWSSTYVIGNTLRTTQSEKVEASDDKCEEQFKEDKSVNICPSNLEKENTGMKPESQLLKTGSQSSINSESQGMNPTAEIPIKTDTSSAASSKSCGPVKKTKSGLMGLIRSHMSPKTKKKPLEHQKSNGSSGSDSNGHKENDNAASSKEEISESKTMKLKTGLVGILRRLSSRHEDFKSVIKSPNQIEEGNEKTLVQDNVEGSHMNEKEMNDAGGPSSTKVDMQNHNKEDNCSSIIMSEVHENKTENVNDEGNPTTPKANVESDESFFSSYAESPESETFITPKRESFVKFKEIRLISAEDISLDLKNIPDMENSQDLSIISAGDISLDLKNNQAMENGPDLSITSGVEIPAMKLLESTSDFLPVAIPSDTSFDSGLDTQQTDLTCQTTDVNSESGYVMQESCDTNQSFVDLNTSKEMIKNTKGNCCTDNNSDILLAVTRQELQCESKNSHTGESVNASGDCQEVKVDLRDESAERIAHSIVKDVIVIAKKIIAEQIETMNQKESKLSVTSNIGSPEVTEVIKEGLLVSDKRSFDSIANNTISLLQGNESKLDLQDDYNQSESEARKEESVKEDIESNNPRTLPTNTNVVITHAMIEEVEKASTRKPKGFDKDTRAVNSTSPARKRPSTLPNVRAVQDLGGIKFFSPHLPRNRMYKERPLFKETMFPANNYGRSMENKYRYGVDLNTRLQSFSRLNNYIDQPSSDEEMEDLSNVSKSTDLILTNGNNTIASSVASSEVWHIDCDGAVVSGTGGVYGSIEEKRARLEDLLGMDLFMKAYHHLDSAQEREGCVVGESVRWVENLLGPQGAHLAHDVLQLVIADAVYHN